MAAKHWVFTLFVINSREEDEAMLRSFMEEHCSYMIYGFETCPSTGRDHFQGYFVLKEKKRFKQTKELIAPSVHIELAKGSLEDNITYCSKSGDFKEYGTRPGSNKGKRMDISSCRDAIKQGATMAQLRESHPNIIAKYPRWVKEELNIMTRCTVQDAFVWKYEDLRSWQKQVVRYLEAQTERQVLWIVDEDGNIGKTFLSKYLLFQCDFQLFTLCKGADLGYELDPTRRGFVFDFARDSEDFVNYKFIEEVKNGIVPSPKYESETKFIRWRGRKLGVNDGNDDPAPHTDSSSGESHPESSSGERRVDEWCHWGRVICFSNFFPKREKLSADRWKVYLVKDRGAMGFSITEKQ